METNHPTETVVLIPTRNRRDLAIKAIASVLSQPVDHLRLIVSDNSTIDNDRRLLATFCRQLSDPRLLYFAPPRPLSMTEHWDWAMGQALQRFDAGSFIYLTDRSLFKPDSLSDIINLARVHPEKVVTYDWVTIFDHLCPITVERQPQTGQLVEVSASRLLFLSSRSIFPRCLPRMMNCCVPRTVIESVRDRFGDVFASTAPDYNFAYRCLELLDGILYYDQAAYVSYAISKSTGAGVMGTPTEGSRDFISCQQLRGHPRHYAVPVPAFDSGINYIVHEYCLLREESTGDKFPRLSRIHYLFRNIEELLKRLVHRLPLSAREILISLRFRMRKLLRGKWPAITEGEMSPGFASVGDAIDYAISVRPSEKESTPHLDLLRER